MEQAKEQRFCEEEEEEGKKNSNSNPMQQKKTQQKSWGELAKLRVYDPENFFFRFFLWAI